MFKRVASDAEIARQIAALLNSHNRLGVHYTKETILAAKGDFIVQTMGPLVAGCVKVERQSYSMTEIKHLVVHPSFRRSGLAKMLVESGINQATTPLIYATIRRDNTASQRTFQSCGFAHVGHYTTGNRDVLLYVTTCPKWKKEVVNSVSPANVNYHRR